MFRAGTVFRYKVSRTVDGRPEGPPYEETYRVISVDGDSVRVEFSSEVEETQTLETTTSFGSYVFDLEGFTRQFESPVQIELEGSLVYVDVMVPPMRCGGSETIWLGRDGVVYKDEKTQMWSMGVVCSDVRKLLSVTVGDRVYDDIKWVDEDDEEEEDPALREIAEFRKKVL